MPPVTLSRFLIEEERNKQVIGSDLRFLVEGKDGPRGRDYNMHWMASMVAVHQRVPVMLGSKSEVERIVAYHRA